MHNVNMLGVDPPGKNAKHKKLIIIIFKSKSLHKILKQHPKFQTRNQISKHANFEKVFAKNKRLARDEETFAKFQFMIYILIVV